MCKSLWNHARRNLCVQAWCVGVNQNNATCVELSGMFLGKDCLPVNCRFSWPQTFWVCNVSCQSVISPIGEQGTGDVHTVVVWWFFFFFLVVSVVVVVVIFLITWYDNFVCWFYCFFFQLFFWSMLSFNTMHISFFCLFFKWYILFLEKS